MVETTPATYGSATMTMTEEATVEDKMISMKLKASNPNRVTWAEDTVDNEFFNKKKSKICCKFEPPRTHPGDSSSSSCGSSDSEDGNAYDRFPKH